MDLVFRKLTPDRVEDFFHFFQDVAFADHPEWGCDCFCCFFHVLSAQEWRDRTAEQNRAIARQMILDGAMQAMLAYDGSGPVAWCHYDRQSNLPGLNVFYPQVIGEQDGDASIVCFTVAQACRRRGVAGRLLDAVCRDLAEQGYQAVQAYPLKTDQIDEENYHGPLSMYLARDFAVIKDMEKQAVVRKILLKP